MLLHIDRRINLVRAEIRSLIDILKSHSQCPSNFGDNNIIVSMLFTRANTDSKVIMKHMLWIKLGPP